MRFIILAIVFISCGETLEGLRELNDPPLINFSDRKERVILEDSLKYSTLGKPNAYTFGINIYDPNNNITQVTYEQLAGAGRLMQGGEVITGTNIDFADEALVFRYYASHAGKHEVELRARDSFGEESAAIVALEVFDNLPPVSAFTFSRDGRYGRRHWVFDASESFDRDEKYGGGITAYAFDNGMGRIDVVQVPGEEVNFDPWEYHVIFPEDNVYRVGVRVRDNDGVWSTWVERVVVVE